MANWTRIFFFFASAQLLLLHTHSPNQPLLVPVPLLLLSSMIILTYSFFITHLKAINTNLQVYSFTKYIVHHIITVFFFFSFKQNLLASLVSALVRETNFSKCFVCVTKPSCTQEKMIHFYVWNIERYVVLCVIFVSYVIMTLICYISNELTPFTLYTQ